MADVIEIIKSLNFKEIQKLFLENKPGFDYKSRSKASPQLYAYSQFNVDGHDVLNPEVRKNKTVFKPKLDPVNGEPMMDPKDQSKNIVQKEEVEVNRVPLPMQEVIVTRRVGFLLGNPIQFDATYDEDNTKEKAVVDYIEEIQENAKMDYRNKEVARRMMSEMECAEIWYLVEDEGTFWQQVAKRIGVKKPTFQLKMKVLSPALGDDLYPLFNGYGDLIAFARAYRVNEDGKEVEHFDVYTDDITYKYAKRDDWQLDDQAPKGGLIKNEAKKIPIIYYQQRKPEWANVQLMIDRLEKVLSNHGDMNDYFGEPILAVFGQIIQAINKGESGKILQLSENAKASFLALDTPPESIKMEVENLEKFIYALSQTPNLSFAELKSMGSGDISGYAMELLFMDAHLATKAKEELFGIGVQRRVNLLKSFIGNVLDAGLKEASSSIRVKPVITPYSPKNIKELIDMVNTSVIDGTLSKITATEKFQEFGYIPDAEQEQERLEDQRKKESSVGLNLGVE